MLFAINFGTFVNNWFCYLIFMVFIIMSLLTECKIIFQLIKLTKPYISLIKEWFINLESKHMRIVVLKDFGVY